MDSDVFSFKKSVVSHRVTMVLEEVRGREGRGRGKVRGMVLRGCSPRRGREETNVHPPS